jgi:hypothetical protein
MIYGLVWEPFTGRETILGLLRKNGHRNRVIGLVV